MGQQTVLLIRRPKHHHQVIREDQHQCDQQVKLAIARKKSSASRDPKDMTRLKASLICLIVMQLVRSNQAEQAAPLSANISTPEAEAAAASDQRNLMQNRMSGCSGDKCVEACEEGWEKNGDHCYYFSTEKKIWFAAGLYCRNKGGHLASVHSDATNDFVWGMMNRTSLNPIWIGGNDIDEEGVWKWTDCTPWDFTVWYKGEPHRPKYNCLNVFKFDDQHELKNANKKWNDNRCVNKQGFVCSKKICSGEEVTGASTMWKPASVSFVGILLTFLIF